MALFESYDRREPQILAVLKNYGIGSIEECAEICKAKGLDIYKLVEGIQPICFENAKWAYTVGCAIAIKKGCKRAADAAAAHMRASASGLPDIFCRAHEQNGKAAGSRRAGPGLRPERDKSEIHILYIHSRSYLCGGDHAAAHVD